MIFSISATAAKLQLLAGYHTKPVNIIFLKQQSRCTEQFKLFQSN
jgi:hypothetical protein